MLSDLAESPSFPAPTGSLRHKLRLDRLDTSLESNDPPPVMRLTSQLDDSSPNDSSALESSSLVIEEVEMGDCD